MQIFYLSVLKVVVESDCSIGTVRTKTKTDEINSTKYHMIIKTVGNCILMLDAFFSLTIFLFCLSCEDKS